MTGNEIHQAKIQNLHPRLARNLADLGQRPVRLDEHVNRNLALESGLVRRLLHVLDHLRHLARRRRLGQRQIGQHVAGAAHQDLHILLPVRVRVVVNARARHLVLVGVALEHARDHLGVLLLAARRRAVLAVAGDVEDRAELELLLERLADQLLRAGEVLARGDDGKRLLALEESVAGMRVGRRHLTLVERSCRACNPPKIAPAALRVVQYPTCETNRELPSRNWRRKW